MASSSGSGSGTSSGSGSPPLTNSGSEGDLQAVMDQRKRKRMLSNRESARRSRMRKRKHLDELMGQVAQLRKENGEILAALNVTTQHYVGVESENSVLRTQMMELSSRLQSLNEILHFIGGGDGDAAGMFFDAAPQAQWNQMSMMNQHIPIMHSAAQLNQHIPIMHSPAQMYQYC